MSIKLSHYSQEPLTLEGVRAWQPKEIEQRPFKPTGLWLSVDGPDDWAAWCQGEGFRLKDYRHRQTITLVSSPNILLLSSAEEIKVFTLAYGQRDDQSPYRYLDTIDWARVQQNYSGIIIAPYQWSCRMDLMWYYPWDAASGCIWDISVIESIGPSEPIEWTTEERSYSDE